MRVQKITRKCTEGLYRIQWLDEWYNQADTIELDTIDLSILVDDIYEDVLLPPSSLSEDSGKGRDQMLEAV